METIRRITDELAIAGQINPEQLQQIAQEEYQSVFNLRLSHEPGFWHDEQQQVELAGLYYTNLPIRAEAITKEVATEAFKKIRQLPKPILVHCSSGVRAATIILMYLAVRQGATLEQAFTQANQLGLFQLKLPVKNFCNLAG
jgi:uncharacterized protein (TIGR01244 family)